MIHGRTIPASLRRAILRLANIGHRRKQPNPGGDKHNKNSKKDRVFDQAMALVVWKFTRHYIELLGWRIRMNVSAIIDDAILRSIRTIAFAREVVRSDRNFPVTARNIEHVVGLT